MSGERLIPLICLFLAVAALMAFWQVNECDFINYDDPSYVTENFHVKSGITLRSIRWAFTTGYSANWHPVTWMSHMLDVQLFGLKPRWHHLTNLLFHIANTLLLFLLFHRMTKAPWKSAFVAALFAIHPLHVESVAWVAERKDVLSTFFWMLAMGAYINYVEHRTEDGREGSGILRFPSSIFRYSAVLIFFVLGLMSKPMLVTFPFVLLLLDYWPLHRFEPKKSAQEVRTEASRQGTGSRERAQLSAKKRKGESAKMRTAKGMVKEEKPAAYNFQWELIRPLLREKMPLFVLAALSSIVTFVVQQKGGAVRSIEAISPGARIANAFVSYIVYIGKTVWPVNLAVYYPHPGWWPLWQVLGAVLLLIAVTISVIRTANRLPFLAVGWLWFAGTLVPVIGIVQVGGQAMADRYTYVPLIGLFVMAAWGIPELLKKLRPTRFPTPRKEALLVLSGLVLVSLFIVTRTQAGYWRNNIALYDHSLEANPSEVIHSIRGLAYGKLGEQKRAISDYNRAVEINPNYSEAYNNRGIAYGKLGDQRQAIPDFDRAIAIDPKCAEVYNNRGVTYDKLGDHRRAIADYDKAVEINPEYPEAYNNRGGAYGALGDQRQAISDYDRAIEINPEYPEAYNNRGGAYGALGDQRQAIADYDRAIELSPKQAEIYYNRGIAYGKLGYDSKEIEDIKTAARFDIEEAKKFLRSRGINW